MSNLFQKKLYEMQVSPPEEVWKKLNAALDEINADNLLAKKVHDSETQPPLSAWENITISLDGVLPVTASGGGTIIILKRLAAAAVIIGVILSAYFIFFNTRQKNTEIVIQPASPKTDKAENPNLQLTTPDVSKENNLPDKQSTGVSSDDRVIASSVNINGLKRPAAKKTTNPFSVALVTNKTSEKEKIGEKIFNQPIDDLSVIASNSNYYTMVNSNGRMVKIPARLTNIASYLQDKPVVEDYFELMFGEGAYWKEKLKDWRRQAAESLQAPSAGSFFDIVDFIKTVQDK